MQNGVEIILDFEQIEKSKDNTHHTIKINIAESR